MERTSPCAVKSASELGSSLAVRFLNTLPATVGVQHAAPLRPEGYALAQDLLRVSPAQPFPGLA
jgi:hypothetical protein